MPGRADPRRFGLLGVACALLALAGGALVLPAGGRPATEVADFYAAHRAAVLLTRAALAVAAAVFFAYASGLGGYAVRGATSRTWTGIRVAAAMLTAAAWLALVPPLVLTGIARSGQGSAWVHRWTRGSDLAEALLFLAIAFWCFMVTVESRRLPRGLRALAALAAVAALLRAGLGVGAIPSALDALAPLAFLAVVLLTGAWLVGWARPEAAPGA